MKTIFSAGNGAVTLTEQGGVFTLNFSEEASVGGGEAAGILKVQGSGSVVLSGKQAFDLGMAVLEAHSPPALVSVEQGAQAMADVALGNA